MRSAARIRLALKVYAFVFLAFLVCLNAMQCLEDLKLALRFPVLSTDDISIPYMVACAVHGGAALSMGSDFILLASGELVRCRTLVFNYKYCSLQIFVFVAEWLWRFLARLLVSWWQLLVDVFDSDRWWDAASQATVFFGSLFVYLVFTVALRSIELEDVEERELRAHQDQRAIEGEDAHA